jgi:hypothetical protein
MSKKQQQVERRMQIYANEMEPLRGEMSQRMDKYANHMGRFKGRNGNVIWLLIPLQIHYVELEPTYPF